MYIDAKADLEAWFHGPGHTIYDHWIPIYHRDVAELPKKHPEIAKEFTSSNLIVQKTSRKFSVIPKNQFHEQNNSATR